MTSIKTPMKTANRLFGTIFQAPIVFLFSTLLSFHGRIGRLQFIATQVLTLWPLALIAITLNEFDNVPKPVVDIALTSSLLYWMAASWGGIFRRLHDLGRSGGWFLVGYILWPLLVLVPGQKYENRYGPPPPYQPVWLLIFLLWPLFMVTSWLSDYLEVRQQPDGSLATFSEHIPMTLDAPLMADPTMDQQALALLNELQRSAPEVFSNTSHEKRLAKVESLLKQAKAVGLQHNEDHGVYAALTLLEGISPDTQDSWHEVLWMINEEQHTLGQALELVRSLETP